jgi:hypothetical protein
MDIKTRLKAHADLLRKILITEQRLEVLNEDLSLPRVTNLAGTSVQGGEAYDRLPLKLNQIERTRGELENLYVLRDQEQDELWQIVNALSSNLESCVLHSYYFCLLNREDTARQLFGSEDDFQQRRRHYLQRVSRLHSEAIKKLRK